MHSVMLLVPSGACSCPRLKPLPNRGSAQRLALKVPFGSEPDIQLVLRNLPSSVMQASQIPLSIASAPLVLLTNMCSSLSLDHNPATPCAPGGLKVLSPTFRKVTNSATLPGAVGTV